MTAVGFVDAVISGTSLEQVKGTAPEQERAGTPARSRAPAAAVRGLWLWRSAGTKQQLAEGPGVRGQGKEQDLLTGLSCPLLEAARLAGTGHPHQPGAKTGHDTSY